MEAYIVNEMLSHYLLLVLGCISVVLLSWRLTTLLVRYVRTVTCLYNDTQRYFAQSSDNYSWFKRNVQYAPILSKRHNREFQLSSAINVGTLPTRLQLVFLLGYFATNVAFCVMTIDFSGEFSDVAKLIRNRTGYLSVVNMIPLFLMAGRNNPLITLLGMSFDTFNLLHRWLGRIVMLEGVAHTVAFLVSNASRKGWAGAFNTTFSVPYMTWGFIVCFLLSQSHLEGPLTNRQVGNLRLRCPVHPGLQHIPPRLLRDLQGCAHRTCYPLHHRPVVPPRPQEAPAAQVPLRRGGALGL